MINTSVLMGAPVQTDRYPIMLFLLAAGLGKRVTSAERVNKMVSASIHLYPFFLIFIGLNQFYKLISLNISQKIMNAKLLSLTAGILLLAFAGKSFGQPAGGGIGFFTPGIHTIQFTELNHSLPAGYPAITSKPFVTAGAGYGIFSNFVLGGEGGTMHAGSFNKDNQQIDLDGSFGFFSLGYLVMNKKGLLVYPLISIGDNDLSMYIHQKDQSGSFETITGEPFQATTLHYKSKMLKLSVAGLYTLAGSKSDKGSAGLMIGLEAGYQMSYKKGVWSFDNGTVTGGPDFNSNGFFVQLMIGGGGVMRK